MGKLNAATFARFLEERAAAKDGYIMGARGQDPKKWRVNSWWFTQYSGARRAKALYWRKNAERVWDCQGLSEGYINQETGSNIDIRARNNYANWCSPKGKGSIPVKYRLPGAAVFSGWPISHVGYLVRPIDPANPAGDWYVVEAKGVMYGVVTTRLSRGRWSRWGLMTKYFSYEAVPTPETPLEIGDRTLRKGMSGDDVREVQSMLIELGYSLGRWGADGDYGSATQRAVRAFQIDQRLQVDGIAGSQTIGALLDVFAHEDESDTGDSSGTVTPDEAESPQEPQDDPQDAEKSEDIQDNTQGDDAAATPPEPPQVPAKVYRTHAIDLSSHNSTKFSKFDWAGLAEEVGFMPLRAGITRIKNNPLGIGKDDFFLRYAEKCEKHGIPIWAYYYGNFDQKKFRGKAAEMKEFAKKNAAEEAAFLWRFCQDNGIRPVGYVYDCEQFNLDVLTFFDTLRELGAARTMLYIGHHIYPHYNLPVDDDGFPTCADALWLPRYGKNDGSAQKKYRPAYPHDLWQHTSVYSTPHIPDKTVDRNIISGQRRTLAWFRGEE